MDEKKAFFAALGNRDQDVAEMAKPRIKAKKIAASASALERGFVQNRDGAGYLLGGAVVLDHAANVVYEWREEHWGDKVPGAALEAACTKGTARL